jgi:transcriptional regulator with XRE-family HTH domain
MNTADKLKALQSAGFTKYRIQQETGVNRSTLTNWELGKTKPDPYRLKAFEAFYFNIFPRKA